MKTTFKVSLLQTQTFQGKEVLVLAKNEEEAFAKARSMQTQPRRWAMIQAKVEASRMETKFRHKGLRSY